MDNQGEVIFSLLNFGFLIQDQIAHCLLLGYFSQMKHHLVFGCVPGHPTLDLQLLFFNLFHLCSDVYLYHTAICSVHMVISNGNLLALESRKSDEM